MSDYPFTPDVLPDDVLIADVIACIKRIELRGEMPDTIYFREGMFPLMMKIKGNSRARKRARFINRKVKAQFGACL